MCHSKVYNQHDIIAVMGHYDVLCGGKVIEFPAVVVDTAPSVHISGFPKSIAENVLCSEEMCSFAPAIKVHQEQLQSELSAD
jgi:hypothetical protein